MTTPAITKVLYCYGELNETILGYEREGRLKFFVACYNDATKDPYSYLLVDMHPQTPDNMRLKTYIYPSENTITYVPK
uniref:DUF1653 domain-containing protein n=1 Tax=Panagrellus redivivus TaxID=6233 RepID=A0A7E4ZQH2_PANRE